MRCNQVKKLLQIRFDMLTEKEYKSYKEEAEKLKEKIAELPNNDESWERYARVQFGKVNRQIEETMTFLFVAENYSKMIEIMEEMHNFIKEKWNEKITNRDTVYILGDMAMRGTQEELIAFVSILKGRKILVKGNHDTIKDLRYKQLYDEICDYKEMRDTFHGDNMKLVLCHYPMLMWREQHHGSILLYGHVHNSIEESYFQKCLWEMNNDVFFGDKAGDSILLAYNVGCMMPYMDYEPRTLVEIIERHSQYKEVLQ